MDAYTGFAQVYDEFMDNIPYDQWSQYVIGLLKEYGVDEGLVLDMGCGTGNITQKLANSGYDMIGIDNAEEMLSIAREKAEKQDLSILYLLQDMREFELYGTVKAVISICDSMNYLLEEEELLQTFQLVNNYLDPEGLFIFDLNTVYKYEKVLGEQTIAENREECSFIWDNFYDKEEMINEYDLTIYVKHKGEGNLYQRFDETHYQRAYSIDTIKRLIEEAGMEFVTVFQEGSRKEPAVNTERIYIVAREKHQDAKYYCETKKEN